jgi:perosamine synthetase
MLNSAPSPRFRLYTSMSLYGRLSREIITGRFRRGADDINRLERAAAAFIAGDEASSFHSVAMPMARVAIYHAVKALVRPGATVIMSPYTIADVVNMAIAAGARPLFADVDPATGNLRPEEVERLADDETGAVLATHFYGCAADIAEIGRICCKRDLPLIEDSAQAFGCAVAGRKVGTFGDVGIYSFGMYKNINAFFGGFALTRDAELAKRLRSALADDPVEPLKTYLPRLVKGAITDVLTYPLVFKTFSFWLSRWAFLKDIHSINNKFVTDVDPKRTDVIPHHYLRRMSPAQARTLLPQFAMIEAANRERIRKAGLYYGGLKDVSELVLPPHRADGSHIYTAFCIQAPARRELVRFMLQRGADIAESYHRNCADLPCFEEFARECPVARRVAASAVYLPNYPRYDDAEIHRNVALIRRFFGYNTVASSASSELQPEAA